VATQSFFCASWERSLRFDMNTSKWGDSVTSAHRLRMDHSCDRSVVITRWLSSKAPGQFL